MEPAWLFPVTTALPMIWRPRLGAASSRFVRSAVTKKACGATATGCHTSFSARSSPRCGLLTPCCPRRGAMTPRGCQPAGWIVDPLDGTREFGETGRTDWAVHVALWERGDLSAGAVALPAQGRILSTANIPATPHGAAATAAGPGQLRIVVSRTRPPEYIQRLADRAGAGLLPLGSAGAKAAAVLCGDADAYVHSGRLYEWDSAAPVAV